MARFREGLLGVERTMGIELKWKKGPPKKPGRYWVRFSVYCPLHQKVGTEQTGLLGCECGEMYDRVLVATKNALFNTALMHCRVPHPDGQGHDPADQDWSR